MGNQWVAVTERVNGSVATYAEWIRSNHLIRTVFSQLVVAYRDLLSLGYYHGCISLDSVVLRIETDPMSVVVKLSALEQVIPASQQMVFVDGSIRDSCSFMAPEVCAHRMCHV